MTIVTLDLSDPSPPDARTMRRAEQELALMQRINGGVFTEAQWAMVRRVLEWNLEPVIFRLTMTSEDGSAGMALDEADGREKWYRRFMILRGLRPDLAIVPTRPIDVVWHAHQGDHGLYWPQISIAFGGDMRPGLHFPYFGMRGEEDRRALSAAFTHTLELFERHWGERPVGPSAWCGNGTDHDGNVGGRPRPIRAQIPA